MPDAATLKSIIDLGVPTAVILLLLGGAAFIIPKFTSWYTAESERRDKMTADLVQQVIMAVGNNTQALSKLCSNTDETTDRLKEHDVRAERIEGKVNEISDTTKRIESAVSRVKGQS